MKNGHSLRLVKSNAHVRQMSFTRRPKTKTRPPRLLLVAIKKHAGRDVTGHISIRHRGGGVRHHYRRVDFSGRQTSGTATIKAIEYDPNRSAAVALGEMTNGKNIYTIALKETAVGTTVESGETAAMRPGNRLPMANILTGVPICNIELTPGRGGQLVRAAGTAATIVAKEGKYAHVRLPSGEIRLIHVKNWATVGVVSNENHAGERLAKAGRVRHLGRRPSVRGKAMNPKDHPHGGGEGVSPIGLKHPKTPTGKPALGYRTRHNPRTQKFILRRRGNKR